VKLYEVIFHGSHGDQPNKDTIYLVRAQDFKMAVDEVSTNASPSHHGGKRFPLAHVVYEVGEDLSLSPSTPPGFYEARISRAHTTAVGERGEGKVRVQTTQRMGGGEACQLTRALHWTPDGALFAY